MPKRLKPLIRSLRPLSTCVNNNNNLTFGRIIMTTKCQILTFSKNCFSLALSLQHYLQAGNSRQKNVMDGDIISNTGCVATKNRRRMRWFGSRKNHPVQEVPFFVHGWTTPPVGMLALQKQDASTFTGCEWVLSTDSGHGWLALVLRTPGADVSCFRAGR